MNSCQFTIVIPTFNYGRYLRRAIDSVLAQAGDDFELIVVDDGSTDDTSAIVRSYDGRLRYFPQQNQGPYLACRKGYEESRGRYLIFLDADDLLCPGALESLRRQTHRDTAVGMVVGRYVNVHTDRQRLSSQSRLTSSTEKNFHRFLTGKLDIVTGATAIHRDGVGLLRPYLGRIRCGMETACIAQTLWHFPAVAINDVLLEVHDHPGRLRNNMREIENAGTELLDAVFNPDILPPAALKYRNRYAARLLRDRARSYYRAGNHAKAKMHFQNACGCDWRSVMDFRNTRRYLISTLRTQFSKPELPEITVGDVRSDGVVQVGGAHRLWGHRRHINEDPLRSITRCAALGDTVLLRLRRPTLLVNRLQDIRYVLVEQGQTFGRTGFSDGFRQFLRSSLFTRFGKDHITSRRVVQPVFHRRQTKNFDGAICGAVSFHMDSWQDRQTLELPSEMMQLTLRAASRAIFGMSDNRTANEFLESIQIGHWQFVKNMRSLVSLPTWLPSKRNRIYRKVLATLSEKVIRIVQDRRRQPVEEFNFLNELMAFRDGRGQSLRDEQICDHILPVFLAAYETTANAITSALYLLANHPQYQQRIHDELDRVDWTAGASCTDQLPVTTLAVNETLRLYPSTWLIARRTLVPHTLPGGAVLKTGMDVYISPFVVHRDERYYDDPLAFRPERFEDTLERHRSAATYFPFGMGPQACLGEYFAKSLITTTIAAILNEYSISVRGQDPYQVYSVNLFTIQPSESFKVDLLRRRISRKAA